MDLQWFPVTAVVCSVPSVLCMDTLLRWGTGALSDLSSAAWLKKTQIFDNSPSYLSVEDPATVSNTKSAAAQGSIFSEQNVLWAHTHTLKEVSIQRRCIPAFKLERR